MFTNGSTAIECGGGLKVAGDAAGDDVTLDVAELPAGFEIHGLVTRPYPSVATTRTAATTGRARLHGEGGPVV